MYLLSKRVRRSQKESLGTRSRSPYGAVFEGSGGLCQQDHGH